MKNIRRLTIKNLGPIKNCEIDLSKMMVLDGPQAAGKSTIAKAIFFFRTVKNSLTNLFFSSEGWSDPVVIQSAQYALLQKLRRIFDLNIWNDDTVLAFEYNPDVKIEITRGKTTLHNVIKNFDGHLIKFSDSITNCLFEQMKNEKFSKSKTKIEKEFELLFEDNQEIVYIPAGRSMLSILSESLSHIFFNFDDSQKNMIDYCTTDYINRVTKVKPTFKTIEGSYSFEENFKMDTFTLSFIQEKMWQILQGKYKYLNGEEFLQLFLKGDKKDVQIKFASSGQQEVLWILNLIYYYLMRQKSTCFIIEEPEAHLYPNTQKEIAEYITMALAENNECVLTTHSPYILGTLSNLLDAQRLMDEGYNISSLLKKENLTSAQLLRHSDFSAYFVDNGTLQNAVDEDNGLIKNELIDGASDKINGFADDLMYLEREGKS